MSAGNDASDEQADVAGLLLDPATHGGAEAERIDTHISAVFLAGDHVYKMKRAVHFGYLDFSTLEERQKACEAEVRINRRTAPGIYRRVVPVTRGADGVLALDGGGEVVEWLVEMRRFDQDMLFDRLARGGRLDAARARALADTIFDFHAEVPPAHADGGGIVEQVIRGNAKEMAAAPAVLDQERVDRLTDESLAWLERVRATLDARAGDGKVRRCHGDLHLRNIVLLDGEPTLFDAIEFSEELATIDMLYDVAFLLMDLCHRDLNETANAVLNRYLMRGGDYSGLEALPLFLSMRAAIRAHTTAAASDGGGEKADEARGYLDLALAFLAPAPACLVAVGGLSGTGKSTVAARVAPLLGRQPGALILRSDGIRKRLRGVAPETGLDPDAYTPEATREVYSTMTAEAQTVLDAGFCAVTDAVFGRESERTAIRASAEDRGLRFLGIWLEAPPDLLAKRIEGRTDDASDADRAVMEQQRDRIAPPADWRRLDASGEAAGLAAEIRRLAEDG